MVKIYKVGGCVRDKLLNIDSHDTDYVVVGATIDYMKQHGFIPVGRDFPVFLHPKTKEQYALARTERKTGMGYHGFKFYATPKVSLEEDLKRRDITINAIAEDEHGNYIDPFNGISDLKNKIIRHISDAFAEDPLRVLRVARFKAKLDFKIAPDTLKLMNYICTQNELEHLSKERIWDEVKKALQCPKPLNFFRVLNQVGALDHILTEFRPIINNVELSNKIEKDLQNSINLPLSIEEKLAIFVANIAYSTTNKLANSIVRSKDLGPNCIELSKVITNNLGSIINLGKLNTQDILKLITSLDPMRKPERFNKVFKILTITLPEKTKVKQPFNFIKEVIDKFKLIEYGKLNKDNQENFVSAINQIKFQIISETYKKFYGK